MLRPLLLVLIAALSPPAGKMASVRLGALEVPYNTAQWRPEKVPDGLRFDCAAKGCGQSSVQVSMTSSRKAPCSDAALRARAGEGGETRVVDVISKSGLSIHAVEHDLGCRNWVAPRHLACVAVDGTTYAFESGPVTCRVGPGGDDAVIDLVRSARRTGAKS